jgi:hypothetical protein
MIFFALHGEEALNEIIYRRKEEAAGATAALARRERTGHESFPLAETL